MDPAQMSSIEDLLKESSDAQNERMKAKYGEPIWFLVSEAANLRMYEAYCRSFGPALAVLTHHIHETAMSLMTVVRDLTNRPENEIVDDVIATSESRHACVPEKQAAVPPHKLN